MPSTSAAPKTPRSLRSGSRALEAGYQAFMREVFDNDIRTVVLAETVRYRALVLADCVRVKLDKKTGFLQTEWRQAPSAGIKGRWRPASQHLFRSFWDTRSEIANTIQSAWSQRLNWHLPSVAHCYPGSLPKRYARGHSPESLRGLMVMRAADRRLGGRRQRTIAVRRVIAGLWNFLVDRAVLKLCHAYFGRHATFDDYNFTVRRTLELSVLAAETPNLTPIIGSYLQRDPRLKSGREPIPRNVLALAKQEFERPESDTAAERRRFGHAPEPLLPKEPLTPAGWRFLAASSGATVHQLWRRAMASAPASPLYGLATTLNLLAATGTRPPYSFVQWAHTALQFTLQTPARCAAAPAPARTSVLRFIRLAGQQALFAKKSGRLKHFISGDLMLAWDWLTTPEARGLRVAAVPKNATWASIMRAQHAWHAQRAQREEALRQANRAIAARRQAEQDALAWDSLVPPCTLGAVTATPLTSGRALRVEGDQMNHCVSNYADFCVQDVSRIFSLAGPKERATAELRRVGNKKWELRQVFGPENARPSRTIAQAAKTLAQLYQTAERARTEKATGKCR